MTVLQDYCDMMSRFACGILALVYERNIPSVEMMLNDAGILQHDVAFCIRHWFMSGIFRRFEMMLNDAGILKHDVTSCMWHFGIGLYAECSVGFK